MTRKDVHHVYEGVPGSFIQPNSRGPSVHFFIFIAHGANLRIVVDLDEMLSVKWQISFLNGLSPDLLVGRASTYLAVT